MNFNEHFKLQGKHAFLAASKPYWLRYDDAKLAETYLKALAAAKGTELHEFAAFAIKLGQKLPRSKKTMNSFVNESIGFRMKPEQVLYYSDNCFGTADAIGASPGILRISDLKTGTSPTTLDQLKIYAAIYCLEYGEKPAYLTIELRIYQNDTVKLEVADPVEITEIMDRIIYADKIIEKMKAEV